MDKQHVLEMSVRGDHLPPRMRPADKWSVVPTCRRSLVRYFCQLDKSGREQHGSSSWCWNVPVRLGCRGGDNVHIKVVEDDRPEQADEAVQGRDAAQAQKDNGGRA